MASHIFCLVPAAWNREQCEKRDCGRGDHRHITRRHLWDLENTGAVEVLHHPASRRDRGLAQWRYKLSAVRGLSCKVGPELALAVYRRDPWAEVCLSEITGRPVRPDGPEQKPPGLSAWGG